MVPRDRVMAHIRGATVDRLPVMPITMMFAARTAGVQYGAYCADHSVLVDSQLRTAQRFGFDHVSCISDPTREATDCGATIQWFGDQPPAIDERRALLSDKSTLAALRRPDPLGGGRMTDRVRAAEAFTAAVGDRLLVEGWVEGPCAEAADLRGINQLMVDFFDDPGFVRELLEFSTELALDFARVQLEAGVDLIGVGDAAASLVGPQIYEEFVRPYEQRLVDGVHRMGGMVRLHICGNTNAIVGSMGRLGCEIVDIDAPVPMSMARAAVGPDQILLGNLDPVAVILNGPPTDVTQEVQSCHEAAGPRFIVGAGCEIPRDAPLGNVEALAACSRR